MTVVLDDPLLNAGRAYLEQQAATKTAVIKTEEIGESPKGESQIPQGDQISVNAEAEIDQQIHHFESVNEELRQGIPENVEYTLPEIPANASKEEKLHLLKQINEIFVDITNAPDQQPLKPKFGHGLAVPMDLKGKGVPVWVDESGVDVDTGEKYNFSAEARETLNKKLTERRAEKAQEFIAEYDKEKEPHSLYAMTKEEYDHEAEKEYPVYILPPQPGPKWDDSILYGDAGNVIRKAAQYSEAHPAGMLLDFLVSLGSIIGRGPYFNVGATRHFTNEFMCRVGDSAKSRKGSARDAIDDVLRLVDPDWYSNRVESGFGSGEAIINRVRDTTSEMRQSRGAWTEVTVPGVDDKRLCIREGEIASIFVLAGKPESRADIVMRDGWDGKPLRNIVKGKGKDGFSNSAKCEAPHLSISGDTTVHELRMKMPTGADENGFGNRFIYVYVHRVKLCPNGGPAIDWTPEIVTFQQVVKFARDMKHVSMSNQARKWWNNNYSRFEQQGPDGLAGKMTARAAAHIRRLAMIYALIDMADQIELEHFHAAEKLWSYCEESAMFIFGGATREQVRILKWIEQRGTATLTQIREDLYHRNKVAAEIKADVDVLVKAGKLAVRNGAYATTQNADRLAA